MKIPSGLGSGECCLSDLQTAPSRCDLTWPFLCVLVDTESALASLPLL